MPGEVGDQGKGKPRILTIKIGPGDVVNRKHSAMFYKGIHLFLLRNSTAYVVYDVIGHRDVWTFTERRGGSGPLMAAAQLQTLRALAVCSPSGACATIFVAEFVTQAQGATS